MIDNRNIRVGTLHHRAELQSKSIVADGGGGDTVTWIKDRDLWCNIDEPSGRMVQEAMRREEQVRTPIKARFNADITTAKRIVFDGKQYMIEAVLRRGLRKEFVEIIAVEGVAT